MKHRLRTFLVGFIVANMGIDQGAASPADAEPAGAEMARVQARTVQAVNARLAALGYPVDPASEDWSDRSRRAAERVLIRLGFVRETATPQAAFVALGNVDLLGGDFPCPVYDLWSRAQVQQGVKGEVNVRITFDGDRPDEFLAAFYHRLAKCHPWALKPAPMKTPGLSIGDTLPSFPVNRTEKATEEFNEAAGLLGKYLLEKDGASGMSAAAPGLVAALHETESIKQLTRAKYAQSADGVQNMVMEAPLPDDRLLADACGELGVIADCAGKAEIEPYRDWETGEALSYIARISHFQISLEISLPEDVADLVIIDGIDAARQTFPEIARKDGMESPGVRFLRSGAEPLSNQGSDKADPVKDFKICADPAEGQKGPEPCGDNAPEQNVTESANRLRALHKYRKYVKRAVEWVDSSAVDKALSDSSNGNVTRRNNNSNSGAKPVKIRIIDPGFDSLPQIQMNNLPCEFDSEGLGDTADNVCKARGKPRFFGFSYNKDIDDVGHGVHVSHIIRGNHRFPGFLGLAGSNEQKKKIEIEYKAEKGDASLGNGGNGTKYLQSNTPLIANRSYHFKEKNPSETSPLPTSRSLYLAIDNDDLPGTRPHFSVIAADYTENPDEESNPCGNHELVCLLTTPLALGVAPVRLGVPGRDRKKCDDWPVEAPSQSGASADWVIMIECADKKYRMELTSTLLVAAPGAHILAMDARQQDSMTSALFGYRERNGSSMAAAIVTSLAARTAMRFPFLRWYQLKRWIWANATPLSSAEDMGGDNSNEDWKSNEGYSEYVAGIVSFQRTLLGDPSKVNVWKRKSECQDNDEDDGDQCQIIEFASVIKYHNDVSKWVNDSTSGYRTFAISRQKKKLFALRFKDDQDDCREDMSTRNGMIEPCFRYQRVEIDDNLECEFFNASKNDACFYIESGSFGSETEDPVDFSKVTHLIGLINWQENGGNPTAMGQKKSHWQQKSDAD